MSEGVSDYQVHSETNEVLWDNHFSLSFYQRFMLVFWLVIYLYLHLFSLLCLLSLDFHIAFLGHIWLTKGDCRGYVWLQELLVDSEENGNDDTRNAHYCPRLELLNWDHQTQKRETFLVPLPHQHFPCPPRSNRYPRFFIVLTNYCSKYFCHICMNA